MENGHNNQELVKELNKALNREISTAVRYIVQGAAIQGQKNEPLRAMYRGEVTDEIGHAQYLADKIVALGGTPQPAPKFSSLPDNVGAMVKYDVTQEEHDVEAYTQLAKLAEDAGEIELKLRMEEQAADESRHAEELRRMVA